MRAQIMRSVAYVGALSLGGMCWAGGQGGRCVSMGALPGKEGEAQELSRPPRPTSCNPIKTRCGANIERYCFFSTAGGGAGSASPKQCIICKHISLKTCAWHDQEESVMPFLQVLPPVLSCPDGTASVMPTHAPNDGSLQGLLSRFASTSIFAGVHASPPYTAVVLAQRGLPRPQSSLHAC